MLKFSENYKKMHACGFFCLFFFSSGGWVKTKLKLTTLPHLTVSCVDLTRLWNTTAVSYFVTRRTHVWSISLHIRGYHVVAENHKL